MPKRKPSAEKKWLPLLGGSVLFGYLGCLSQESGPTTGPIAPHPPGADSVARADTSAPVAARPDTLPPPNPVIVVRNGPTLGEACDGTDDRNFACTREGVPVKCSQGRVVEGSNPEVSGTSCTVGDTLLHSIHMGFNGLDRAVPLPIADRVARARIAC